MSPHLKQPWHYVAVGAIVIALVYSSTLMLTVSGGDSDFVVDSGEFQVALAEWGTAHYTGYPLYMLLGSPFVSLLRLIGIPPAAGASIYSLLWAVIAVGGAIVIASRLTGQFWLALGCAVVFGLSQSMWIHASIPEVYSLSMAILVVILAITFSLLNAETWDDQPGWWLALAGGLGVAHHRLIAVALPVIGLVLLPKLVRNSNWRFVARWLLIAVACFALGFLPYLDMPLRAWRGATWMYGQPGTWGGFWYIFFGTEVKDWQKPVFEAGAILINLRDMAQVLANELTWPGLAACLVGSVVAASTRLTRRPAILLLGIAFAYVLFSALTRKAVLLQANLMPVVLCLTLGLGLGLKVISKLFALIHHVALAALLLWASILFVLHRPVVLALSRNPDGVNYVARFEKLDGPAEALVMSPWGWRYFALSYAQRLEGKFSQWNIVDHRADFAALTRDGDAVFTAADTFYIFTADDFWKPRIGGAHLSSAGPGLVEIRREFRAYSPNSPLIELGDGIALADVAVSPPDLQGNVNVMVWWAATAKPTHDYSTFVHVSDADSISSSDDVIAQGDQIAPVYAWYATSKWSPGELVREDHALTLPPDRPARLIVVGMYRRDEAGNFINLGSVNLRNDNGAWVIR